MLLRNASIHSDGLVYLFARLSKHPKLKNLDLASNARLQYKSACQLGHYFVFFEHLENVSLENLGFNDDNMNAFLHGMYYPPILKSCIMPLKTIHFGDKFKLSKMKQFFNALSNSNELDFYYKSNMYKAHRKKGSVNLIKYADKLKARL